VTFSDCNRTNCSSYSPLIHVTDERELPIIPSQ